MTDTQTPQIKLERWKDWYRKIPYGKIGVGYKVDPEDPLHIIPDVDQIVFVEQAFDYIDAGSSLREVSEWLGQKLLRTIAHQTISNLYRDHRKPFTQLRYTKRKIHTGKIVRSKEATEKSLAKRAITNARKKYNSLEQKYKDKQLKAEDFDNPELAPEKKPRAINLPHLQHLKPQKEETDIQVPKFGNDISIVFQPNEGPQTDFLSATETEVLYGGSAGGEPKTWFSASFPSNRSK